MQTVNKNELDKASFQQYMAYGKSNALAKRTQTDKVLKEKAFKIDPKVIQNLMVIKED